VSERRCRAEVYGGPTPNEVWAHATLPGNRRLTIIAGWHPGHDLFYFTCDEIIDNNSSGEPSLRNVYASFKDPHAPAPMCPSVRAVNYFRSVWRSIALGLELPDEFWKEFEETRLSVSTKKMTVALVQQHRGILANRVRRVVSATLSAARDTIVRYNVFVPHLIILSPDARLNGDMRMQMVEVPEIHADTYEELERQLIAQNAIAFLFVSMVKDLCHDVTTLSIAVRSHAAGLSEMWLQPLSRYHASVRFEPLEIHKLLAHRIDPWGQNTTPIPAGLTDVTYG
jgi:hypothetical protein